jgi:profilin
VTVKTVKAILIGLYDDKIQPGQAANVVEKLADYLIDSGY